MYNLKWKREEATSRRQFWLTAGVEEFNDLGTDYEAVFKEIQNWSSENNCGVRMAYNMWSFRNEQEMVYFLLKWQ